MTIALALKCLAVFFDLVLVDICWAMYTKHVAAGNPKRAAFWSMAIMALGSFAVISYASNHWLLIPAALGAYAGTYLAVKPGLIERILKKLSFGKS